MKQKKWPLLLAAAILLSAFWVWRYRSLNRFYQAHTIGRTEYFSMGEEIPFGEDMPEIGEPAEGYVLQANRIEIVDFQEYILEKGISLEELQNKPPEKLALVHIVLRNDYNEDSGINLSSFRLYRVDSAIPLDYELIGAANPILPENAWGGALPEGTECAFVLPYMLYRDLFDRRTWNRLEEETFFFQITVTPTAKYIQMNAG